MEKHHHIEKEELQGYVERIRFNPVETDPDVVFEKIRYRIRYGVAGFRGVSPVWRYAAVAATVALLVVSALFIYFPKEKAQSLTYINVKAIPGSKTRVVLPDSSEVWLNSNASIRYPQQFTTQSRRVEFSGEALFTITKDRDKPFIVDMDGMKVEVLGTMFNIHSNPKSDIIETTLLEGSVAIFSDNNHTQQADLVLSSNEQALFNRMDSRLDVRHVRASMYSAWASGIYHFENDTLEEIMKTLSRAFDVTIHLESKLIGNKRFTAQFFHQETLEDILSVLQISAKYQYKKVKGEIYITDK